MHGLDRLRLVFEAVGERPVQAVVDQELQRERIVPVLVERALAVVLLLPEPVEVLPPGAQIVHVPNEPPTLLAREDPFEDDVAILPVAILLFGRQAGVRSCHWSVP